MNIIGKTIPKPNRTFWNSQYDNFKAIYESRAKIKVLMERLTIQKFSELEPEFLAYSWKLWVQFPLHLARFRVNILLNHTTVQ